MAIAGGSGETSLGKSGMSGPFILGLERFLIMQPNVFTITDPRMTESVMMSPNGEPNRKPSFFS